MTCPQIRTWSPISPCCGTTAGFCAAFPDVNWSKAGWKVTLPASRLAGNAAPRFLEQQGNLIARRGFFPEDYDAEPWFTYVGDIPQYFPGPPVLGDIVFSPVVAGAQGRHYPGGTYLARYTGSCAWEVNCRELLIPGNFAIAILEKPSAAVSPWYITAGMIFGNQNPYALFEDAKPFGGFYPFVQIGNALVDNHPDDPFVEGGTTADWGHPWDWRRVLKEAECSWLSARVLDGWQYPASLFNGIDGGLLNNLANAAAALQNAESTPRNSDFYRPNAMDIAMGFAQVYGLSFGIENDSRSPYYGQFIIRDGADLDYQLEQNELDEWHVTSTWITSTPWELQTGEVTAEFGHVNRWERTDNNDCLPEWVELELVQT